MNNGVPLQVLAGPIDQFAFLLVSPDDRALASVYRTFYENKPGQLQTWLRIWQVDSGEVKLAGDLALEDDPDWHPYGWSADSRQFAVSAFFGPVYIYKIP